MEKIALVGELTVYVRKACIARTDLWEVVVLDAAGSPVGHSIEGTMPRDVARERARYLAGNLISGTELRTHEGERSSCCKGCGVGWEDLDGTGEVAVRSSVDPHYCTACRSS